MNIAGMDALAQAASRVTYSATGAVTVPPTTVAGAVARLELSVVGTTTVVYSVTDRAGQVSSNGSITVLVSPVDTVAPEAQVAVVQTGTSGVFRSGTQVAISGTDDQAMDRVEWKLLIGGTVTSSGATGASGGTVSAVVAGATVVEAVAVDRAGNRSAPRSVAFRIDERPVLSTTGTVSVLEPDESSSATRGAYVQFVLDRPAATDTVVSYFTRDGAATGCATGTCDYTRFGTSAAPRTLTIPAGQVQGTVGVPVRADSAVEPDETFDVVVAGVSSGAVLGTATTQTVRIVDPDAYSGVPVLTLTPRADVSEGDTTGSKTQVVVHLSKPLAAPLAFTWSTADLTARAGVDYRALAPVTVTIPAGATSKTIDLPLVPNAVADGDRQFLLTRTAATSTATFRDLAGAAVVTIIDDDARPVPVG